MNHRKRILFLFVILGMIAGCMPKEENILQPVVTILPPATSPVIVYTPTPLPTQTIVSTPILPPTPTLTVEEKCMKIEDQVTSDLQFSGVWVIGKTNPYLEDIETGRKIGIPLKGTNILSTDFEGFAVSPNREWFAYVDQYVEGSVTNKRILRIINSSGKSLPMDFWSENFQWIIGWVDDNHIALELNKTSVSRQKIVIINPFTGEYKDITPTWIKDFHSLDPYWIPEVHYSPNVNRAVVASNRQFELRNVQSGETLFQGKNIDTLPDLAWSSDSSKLAIVENSNNNLYIIDNEVVDLKLESLSFDTIFRFWGVWWSPDGQNLLFHVDKLHILNLESHKITTLCFDDKSFWTRYREPLWSPNNRFIVISVEQRSTSPEQSLVDVIIDLKDMRAYKLPRKPYYYERLAWLVTP